MQHHVTGHFHAYYQVYSAFLDKLDNFWMANYKKIRKQMQNVNNAIFSAENSA